MATTITQDLVAALTGRDPKVPQWTDIDPSAVQQETLRGNLATFEGAKQFASSFNDFMREQVAKGLREQVPGYVDLSSTLASNLAAQLRGELTSSDAAAEQRSSVARALGLGLGGSPAGAAFTARNLGLRQYQVQQNAQAQVPGYLNTMAGLTRAPAFDFSSLFLTAPQRWQMNYTNQVNRMNQQWLKEQIDSQPNKIGMAFARQLDEDVEMGKQLAVSYYGGGMGGMGGMGGGGGGGWSGGGGIRTGPGGAQGGWGGT